jgi:hypothetical protein
MAHVQFEQHQPLKSSPSNQINRLSIGPFCSLHRRHQCHMESAGDQVSQVLRGSTRRSLCQMAHNRA